MTGAAPISPSVLNFLRASLGCQVINLSVHSLSLTEAYIVYIESDLPVVDYGLCGLTRER